MKWLHIHDEFVQRYARACEARTWKLAEETLEIADKVIAAEKVTIKPNGDVERVTGDAVERSKLMVETRLKLMATLNPKRFGQKVDVNHSGTITLEALITRSMETPAVQQHVAPTIEHEDD
jgi:hypothetical protein